ncbi:MAG: bifunctional phosphoribosyl-AMP cyclohydrolase/phosphoribosyl-ATP diphosphatase HisIE [Lachnospiraceae bacterium]|nr:bifunctional phosphoribosyl-AMP cyclohydrolase/phosphoribosyl-ATP diphosphatase HisIE [Lachnospiraceae bacterium]
MVKKFVASIYLFQNNAVRGFSDHTVVDTDPVRLAENFCKNSVDELMVFDLSDQAEYESVESADAAHEASLDTLKEIVSVFDKPVFGGGNIRRMEDVKKILYTGCAKAILDYDRDDNFALTDEVNEKFGAEKLLAMFNNPDRIKMLPSEEQKKVSGFVLLNVHQLHETEIVSSLPFYARIDQILLNKLLEFFAVEQVCGVTGNTINDNVSQILSLKELCSENGIEVKFPRAELSFDDLKTNDQGLVPVIVQDEKNDEVLMMAYMNRQAFQDTIRTGMMHYYSRSRQEQWLKGETSGHYQYVKSLTADCDYDTILAKVSQVGAACHTGNRSCFFNEIIAGEEEGSAVNPLTILSEVYDTIADRKENPREGSYTNYLFDKGVDKILKKVGEEATEIVIAAKNPNVNEIKYEISDFLYHMMVLMVEKGVTWEEIAEELANRH